MHGHTHVHLNRCPDRRVAPGVRPHQGRPHPHPLPSRAPLRRRLSRRPDRRDYRLQPDQPPGLVPPLRAARCARLGRWPRRRQPRQAHPGATGNRARFPAPIPPRQLFGPETATPDGQFWTVPDLKRAVQAWFEVTWSSPSSYLALLADCGFTYQRAQKVYTSRSERAILAFEEQLEKN